MGLSRVSSLAGCGVNPHPPPPLETRPSHTCPLAFARGLVLIPEVRGLGVWSMRSDRNPRVREPRDPRAPRQRLASCRTNLTVKDWRVYFRLLSLLIKKAREFQKSIYFCFIDCAKAFDCVDHNKLWKILKEMGIPDHLTCFLRNLYAGQEATVRTGRGTTDWFQIRKGIRKYLQGCFPGDSEDKASACNAGDPDHLNSVMIWLCHNFWTIPMATHSSILAWRIPGTEEPGGLLSMGLHRVGYD
ncbi:uncharacterized protein [Odocoileus virginianus]|uniref:Reverse transcriptase domain-containing protein n=1 Tax=Odocoileus virginianus TaxID=9874 RepID=A0ABM4H6U5_ODOVR